MRHGAIGGIALAATLVLAGCSGQDEAVSNPPTSAAPSPASPTTPDLESFTAPPSGLIDEDTGQSIEPQSVPQWDGPSRQSAIDSAETAMRAFARPEADYETWWAELEPLLNPQAAEDYAYVDPANVPATEVTGPADIVDETSAYVARVEVPTDIGPYTLVLHRTHAEAPWLIARLSPPQDAN